ncbi:STM3941 family protein [Weeksellaceae bacterium A-14]
MNKIEFYSNKKKAFLLLIGSLFFVILGVYLFLNAENMTGFRARNPLFIKIAGIASVLFFGLGIYVSIKQLIKNKLMLIIDENGINVNPQKNEYIKWNDIEGFADLKINSVKIIIIQINNAEEYIEKESNKLRKKLMKFNLENYGSPYNISVATMNTNYNQLYKILNENLIKYKYIA